MSITSSLSVKTERGNGGGIEHHVDGPKPKSVTFIRSEYMRYSSSLMNSLGKKSIVMIMSGKNKTLLFVVRLSFHSSSIEASATVLSSERRSTVSSIRANKRGAIKSYNGTFSICGTASSQTLMPFILERRTVPMPHLINYPSFLCQSCTTSHPSHHHALFKIRSTYMSVVDYS